MLRTVILVFLGGATGALAREFLMLLFPTKAGDFPLSIFVANVIASMLIGYVSGLHSRAAATDDINTFTVTGFAGGLSTFSSFAYATLTLLTTSASGPLIGVIYATASLVCGYVGVVFGIKLATRRFGNFEQRG